VGREIRREDVVKNPCLLEAKDCLGRTPARFKETKREKEGKEGGREGGRESRGGEGRRGGSRAGESVFLL